MCQYIPSYSNPIFKSGNNISISFPSKTVLSFGIIFYIKNNLKLKDEETKIKDEETKIKDEETKIKDEETKIKVHNQLNKFQENVLKSIKQISRKCFKISLKF